jgi:hypothetical protein
MVLLPGLLVLVLALGGLVLLMAAGCSPCCRPCRGIAAPGRLIGTPGGRELRGLACRMGIAPNGDTHQA